MQLESDLNWMSQLLSDLPEAPINRKNLIEIAGYPNREAVNSNLLAFYLDENEEHGFGRLFLNSILDLLEEKGSLEFPRHRFEGGYTVEREVSTAKSKRIDIVVRPEASEGEGVNSSWALIIENKIFSSVYNPFEEYWSSIEADMKFGVVLSIKPENLDLLRDNGLNFVNILHIDLVKKVLSNLPSTYMNMDQAHMMFLREYIANVKSHYRNENEMYNLDLSLRLFHKKRKEIEGFKKKDFELLQHISSVVFAIFTDIGFPPFSRKDSSKSKHFYLNDDFASLPASISGNIDIANKFRFWIDLGELRYNSVFTAYFELYGRSNTLYGDELKSRLRASNVFGLSDKVLEGSGGSSGSAYQHIYKIVLPIGDFSKGFDITLRDAIQSEFVGKGYIERAIGCLDELVNKSNSSD
jgi:hypothetical protein